MKWSEVSQLCPTLCDPIDCSLPDSSVHGIFQAIVLEWIAISFSRGSSQPRDRTRVSRIVDRRFTVWATREVQPLIPYIDVPGALLNTEDGLIEKGCKLSGFNEPTVHWMVLSSWMKETLTATRHHRDFHCQPRGTGYSPSPTDDSWNWTEYNKKGTWDLWKVRYIRWTGNWSITTYNRVTFIEILPPLVFSRVELLPNCKTMQAIVTMQQSPTAKATEKNINKIKSSLFQNLMKWITHSQKCPWKKREDANCLNQESKRKQN